MSTDQQKKLRSLVLQYAKPRTWKSSFEYILTWFVFILNCYCLFETMQSYFYLTPLFVLIQSLLIVRVFILQHDCGHYALFNTRLANDIAGIFCNIITLPPYHYWRDAHAVHHKLNGNMDSRPWIGDIDILTIQEFKVLKTPNKLVYIIKRNIAVLFLYGWIYHFFSHRIKIPKTKLFNTKRLIQTHLTNVVQIALFSAVVLLFSVKFFILAVLIPAYISAVIGLLLFYVQHNFETSFFYTEQEKLSARDKVYMRSALEGSSCLLLPPILRWFTGNIGYHHIHHLSSKIPFYNLHKMYINHPECQNVYKISFRNLFKQFSYKLYDPVQKKMITWKDYKMIENKVVTI